MLSSGQITILSSICIISWQKHHSDIHTAKIKNLCAQLLGGSQQTPALPVSVWAIPLAGFPIKRANQLFHKLLFLSKFSLDHFVFHSPPYSQRDAGWYNTAKPLQHKALRTVPSPSNTKPVLAI